jgi:hypothetical protein
LAHGVLFETFEKRDFMPNFVIPAPHQVRDKLQPESSNFNYFLDSPVKPGNDTGGGFRIPGPDRN